jgi:phospholipid/cholesterol/gamma-HCH transport system permease protein
MDALVVPKILGLALALPLLTVYADALGVFGGMLIARVRLDVEFLQFLDRFQAEISPEHYLYGLFKAPIFAVIISLVGCHRGFLVTGSAESVGHQTTASVVICIFFVIVVDAILSVLFSFGTIGG